MRRRHSLKLAAVLLALTTASAACSKKDSDDDSSSDSTTETPATGTGTINTTNGGTTTPPPATSGVTTPAASTYQPTATPGTIAVQLPLALTTSGGAGLRLAAADPSAEASTEQSEGYAQLRAKISEIPPLVADLTEKLYLFDQALPALAQGCVLSFGTTWTSCPTFGVESTFTKDMANGIVAKVGSDVLGADAVAALLARDGEVVALGDITVTRLTDDPSGYTTCVEIAEDETSSARFCFNATDTQVVYRDTDGEGSEGTYSLSYRAADEVFTVAFDLYDARYIYKDRFVLKRDPAAAATHGVTFTASVDDFEKGYGSYTMAQTGIADDKGGAVQTQYEWTEHTVTGMSLSSATTDGAEYVILPAGVAADLVVRRTVGYVTGNGTTGLQDYLDYFGDVPAPASMTLWTASYDDEGYESYTPAGITVNSLSVTTANGMFFYSEQFDASGNLTYWCSRDTVDGACVGSEGEEGDDYEFEDEEIETLTLSFAGINANAAALSGVDLYVFPAGYSPAGLSYDDEAAWEKVLAEVKYYGDADELSEEDMTGYESYFYINSAASYEGAKAYYLDSSDRYVLVSSLVITAAE